MKKAFAERTHEKMQEVLMDSNGIGPDIHYYMIRGGIDKKNITIWESGNVNGEYIKTYGHYHVGDLEENYTVLAGKGIIILQDPVIDDSVKEFKAIFVKVGDTVHIPKKIGHMAINIGKTWFITSDDSPVNFEDTDPIGMPGHADYEIIKKMRGFAYYIVEKDGKPSFVKNPLYKNVPEVRIM